MDKAVASRFCNVIAPAVRTCLYVEDSEANLMLVQQLVARRDDVKLLSATSGLRGVEMAQDEHPDVIMMDINLPGLSGLEALRLLRADPSTARTPISAVSSNAYPKQIEECLREGFFRYLTKPFKLDEFNKAIDDMLLYSNKIRRIR